MNMEFYQKPFKRVGLTRISEEIAFANQRDF